MVELDIHLGAITPESINLPQSFPLVEQAIQALSDPELQAFATTGASLILGASEKLRENGMLNATDEVAQGLMAWIGDPQHGATHSFHVFEGAKAIRAMNSDYGNISDVDLAIRALLHDIGEFLPLIGAHGQAIKRPSLNRSKLHAPLIHRAVKLYGPTLGIPNTEALARDLLLHDYSYKKPTRQEAEAFQKQLTPAGRLFVDADRFAGAGPINDEQITKKTIERNRSGSLGKWYIFRPDLTARDRLSWEPRTGGFFDGVSAIFQEFLGFPDYFANTPEGKMLARKRKKSFGEDVLAFYTDTYHVQRPLLEHAWSQHKVDIGIKEKDDMLRFPDELSTQLSALPFQEAMDQLVHTPVPKKGTRNGRSYYGYSLSYDGTWYDPSILQFPSEEVLRDALLSSMIEYEQKFTERTS